MKGQLRSDVRCA